jgi:hypothetical protein
VNGFDGQSLVSGVIGSLSDSNLDPTEIRPLFNLNQVFHYKVTGTFDSKGRFKGKFVNQRGDGKPRAIEIAESSLASDEAPCGKIKLRLNIYDREGDAVDSLIEKLDLTGVGRVDANPSECATLRTANSGRVFTDRILDIFSLRLRASILSIGIKVASKT